jgi:hypothetical protein
MMLLMELASSFAASTNESCTIHISEGSLLGQNGHGLLSLFNQCPGYECAKGNEAGFVP